MRAAIKSIQNQREREREREKERKRERERERELKTSFFEGGRGGTISRVCQKKGGMAMIIRLA